MSYTEIGRHIFMSSKCVYLFQYKTFMLFHLYLDHFYYFMYCKHIKYMRHNIVPKADFYKIISIWQMLKNVSYAIF